MFEMDESMNRSTDVSDMTLQFLQETYGPKVKDWLLLPDPVPIAEVKHVDRVAVRA